MCCCTTLWNVNVCKSLYTVQSLMVSVGVSKLGCTHLTFVDPGVKINGCYCHEVLLSQQLLPAIWQVSGDFFVFQQDSALAHRERETITSFSAFKISLGSVATHLRWGGIFINNFIANFLLNVSVKDYEIGQYLPKIWTRVECAVFWPTLYIGLYTTQAYRQAPNSTSYATNARLNNNVNITRGLCPLHTSSLTLELLTRRNIRYFRLPMYSSEWAFLVAQYQGRIYRFNAHTQSCRSIF